MGYTFFSKSKIQKIIDEYHPKSVIDLGAQNDFSYPYLPAPYASEWYKEKGIDYMCIDLNGENNASRMDLSKSFFKDRVTDHHKYLLFPSACDLLVDCGTSEHVSGEDGKFSWEAIYNCWHTKHILLKKDGIMYSENPKTKNWSGHGCNYYTQEFYIQLAIVTDYTILELGEHPAMNNVTDGWNIYCIMKKNSEVFPNLYEFKKLPIFKY